MTTPTGDDLTAALEHHRAGNVALAEQLYRQIVASEPNNADAWHLLGALCLQSGRPAEAVELISKAVGIQSTNADYYSHLGAAYGALGHHDSAVTSLRRAVQIAPQSASAHYNLGTALVNQGRHEDAVASFRHAIAVDRSSAQSHYNLANALRELKRYGESEASYRAALAMRPGYLKALINLANVLRAQERLAESVETLRGAVAIDPNHANAWLNLGTALRDTEQLDEAVVCLRRAVALAPNSPEPHNNLGTVLQGLARFDEAEACYEQALCCDSSFPDAHFGRAFCWLLRGDVERGFAEYEWRWKCGGFSVRPFEQPWWDGAPLNGQTILLYAEQGLGDTLQFVRHAADVKQLGGRVIVECQPPLVRLLEGMPAIDQIIALGSPLPRFDTHAPLMSLPGILKLSFDRVWSGPYLSASPQLVDEWRERLVSYAGFRVGLCWQGNSKYLFDSQRSFPLSRFAPLAKIPGVRFVSLQKGEGADQVANADFQIVDLSAELDEAAGPFMDTAAVMKNLDLVITSDTSVAHLAGGLGVPVWVALSAHTDWRWMLDRRDTPWYPSMRLFRQRQLNEWDEVFAAIAEELALLVINRSR